MKAASRRSCAAPSTAPLLLRIPRYARAISISMLAAAAASVSTSSPFRTEFCSYSTRSTRLPGSGGVEKVEDALAQLNRMLAMNHVPSIIEFNKLLGFVVRMKHYSTAIALIKQLEQSSSLRVKLDVCTLNIMINCFSHLHMPGPAFSVFATILKLGLQPNVATFNTLIRGLCVSGRVFEATRFFKQMRRNGYRPDVVTIGTLINGLRAIGEIDRALQMLRMMDHFNIKPNVVAYNTILDGFCNYGKIAEASDLFSEMTSKGIHPDVITYNILIDGMCRFGLSKQARTLFMDKNRCSPNEVTFNTLIQGLLQNNEFSRARYITDVMIDRGFSASDETIEMMVHMHDVGKLDMRPFLGLMNGFCKHQMLDKAVNLLQDMDNSGCSPNKVTFNTLIQGLLQNNEFSRARHMIDVMLDRGFSASDETIEMMGRQINTHIVYQACIVIKSIYRFSQLASVIMRNFTYVVALENWLPVVVEGLMRRVFLPSKETPDQQPTELVLVASPTVPT